MRQRRRQFTILTMAVFALLGRPAAAVDYYVAATGNDANPGTLTQPFRTVTQGAATAQAGDTIYIRGGTYPEAGITFANSGTLGNPITLTNYPGEDAIVDAGYTSSPDNLWHPVFSIDGRAYITFRGGNTGSLHLMRGAKATIMISPTIPSKGISVINVEFSGLVANDNSGSVFAWLGSGGIAANGDPVEDRILVQDCYFHDMVVGPKWNDAHVMMAPAVGDVYILNNVMVGGDLAVHFKRPAITGAAAVIRGNQFLDYTFESVLLNTDGAVLEHNLFSPALNTRFGSATAVRVYEGNGGCSAIGNVVRHNTIINLPGRPGAGIHLEPPRCAPGSGVGSFQTRIEDNVVVANSPSLAVWLYAGTDGSETTVANNNFCRLVNPTGGTLQWLEDGVWYQVANMPAALNPTGNIQALPVFVNDTNADPLLNDYTLAPGSPGTNAASDGTDMGADMTIVGRYRGAAGGNARPTVTATAAPTSALVSQAVTFTAGATDTDGSIVSLAWTFGDGATGTGSSVTHAYGTAGTYVATVTATDNGGATATATTTVTVTDSGGGSNTPPQVALAATPTTAGAGQTVSFAATASDSDGTIAAYAWNFGDGVTAGTGASTTHAYAAAGTYTAQVTVTDDGGATASATVQVTIASANVPPAVTATASPTTVLVSQVVTLTASATDADGTIVSTVWTLGDGASTSGTSVTHIYSVAGTYTAQVTVTDNGGATASTSVTVTVTDGSTPLPADECANWQIDHPDWIWCDDFEQALTLAQKYGANGLTVGANASTMTTTTATSAGGTHALTMRWNAGEDDAGSFRRNFGRTPYATSQPDKGMGPYFEEDFQEIYYRYYTMHPSGFVGWPDKSSRSFISAANSAHQWGPQAMVAHVWSATGDSPFLALDPASGVDTNGNLIATKWNDFNNFRWLGLQQASVPRVRGQWHCVEVRVKLNTVGVADGVFELWIDGQLAATESNLDWTNTWRDFGINSVSIESFWNAGSPVQQEGYFDSFVISRSRIGCQPPAGNVAPVVSAGASPAQANTGDTVTFTATASDADGSVVGYNWDFGDGVTATGPVVTHAYATAGTQTATVTVTDDAGATATASVTVAISAPVANQPPTVSAAAAPSTVVTGEPVTFTATASDADGSVVGYNWSFGDGVTATGPVVTHAYATAGTQTATVTVTDDQGATAIASTAVSVGSSGGNPAPGAPPSVSVPAMDADGTYTVTWGQATGQVAWYDLYEATAADFSNEAFVSVGLVTAKTLTGRAPGTYYYRVAACNASDNCSAKTAAANPVVVPAPNQPPTVSVGAAPTLAVVGQPVSFSAAASDPDGTIASYAWKFGDGGVAGGADTSHAYAVAGTYTASVTVTDDGGATASATVAITAINAVPIVSASATPATVGLGEVVTFSATATVNGGTIVGYVWTFGDGATSAGATATHAYTTPGTFTAQVTATAGTGATATAQTTVTVANQPPAVSLAASPTTAVTGESVTFTSSGSDPDGTIVSAVCDFGDGTSAPFTGATVTHSYAAPGTYTATVTATDDFGATAAASVSVTITAPNQPPTVTAAASVSSVTLGTVVDFTATPGDADGTVVSTVWDFGDGTSASTANASHVYTAGGAYTATVTVTDDDGATATASVDVTVVIPPATDVTLSTSVPTPQPSGTAVTFAGQGVGGTGDYEYEFWRSPAQGTRATLVQSYSPNAQWVWDTTSYTGSYLVTVYVRSRGSGAMVDAQTNTVFHLNQPNDPGLIPATGVTLSVDLATPQSAGAAVTVTAQGSGGTGAYEYLFWIRATAGGSWTAMQGYGATSTWVWDTTVYEGTYDIMVYLRTAGSTVKFDAVANLLYEVTPAAGPDPPGGVTLQ